MLMLMPDIQMSWSSEPPLHRIPDSEIQNVQSTKAKEVLPVRRLDGEVTKTDDVAFAAGPHCEIWRGQWVKGRDVEKVRLRLIMSTPLTWPFVGGLENASSISVTREGA